MICPKCKQGNLGSLKYCRGQALVCPAAVLGPVTEHLHADCPSCGFMSTAPCADENKHEERTNEPRILLEG